MDGVVHEKNYSALTSYLFLIQRIWRFLYQNFVFGWNKSGNFSSI